MAISAQGFERFRQNLVFALIAQDHFVDLLQIVLADFIATLLPLLPGWVDKDDSRDDRRNPDSGHESDHDNAQIGRAHVELQSLMRHSYAVFCLKKKNTTQQ